MGYSDMNIVIDRNIPFIATPLAGIGRVTALPGAEITPEVIEDTDILITRTRTRCDASLLDRSRCRFIGTATIGTDHIDIPYCTARGITVANAPGCNAPAVAQWVLAAIASWLKPGESFRDVSLGVIGAGNVGSILIRWAKSLGIKILVNDPPLQEREPEAHAYSSLSEIARECNVITVHTPLTCQGTHPTLHLIDTDLVGLMERKPLVLNAARGPVTDTWALIRGLEDGRISAVGIDCWESEPAIDSRLLDMAFVATPHIAGYSRQGKIRASQMVLDALGHYLGSDTPLRADAPLIGAVPETITPSMIAYDILADTRMLKSAPDQFESLRNNYHLREEPGM